MTFIVEVSEDAERHLSQLGARDRTILIDVIEEPLTHEPTVPTRRRKLLRENPLATWELRVGDYRVFYNVDAVQSVVILIAVGRKVHNALYIEGKEFLL
jgi:mRNA-degrading endonuclease RelE of RelBE toxin-antitoxin system